MSVLRVENLTVVAADGRPVLDRVSLDVRPGERVGVVGESGSGKTTLALAMLGAVRRGLSVVDGGVFVGDENLLRLSDSALRALRRRVLAYLPQDPASALTPTLRVRGQLAELATDRTDASLLRRLAEVGLPAEPALLRRYPHQLSGGQQQRLALARMTAGDPRLLVLDELTTGLDALVQKLVLDQVDALVRRHRMALVFITHDHAAVERMTDRLVVVEAGRVVADGPVTASTRRPVVVARATPPAPGGVPVLRVDGVSAGHPARGGRTTVVRDVSFDVAAGECVALFGVSGSGKTTLARCLSGTHVRDAGSVSLHGEPLAARVTDRTVPQRRRIQLVPQHSAGSLNPRRTVGAAIRRPLRRLHGLDRAAAREETARLLELVGLPATFAGRFPAQLSGGQRQRVTIARALAARPDLLVCDEMTSSLDAGVQAKVLDLVADLRERLGLALVVITHDRAVLARLADRVLVLHEGTVCEEGPVGRILDAPTHPWTRTLVAA